jgi:hypothetical protein
MGIKNGTLMQLTIQKGTISNSECHYFDFQNGRTCMNI